MDPKTEFEEQAHSIEQYPLANLLMERPRRRMNNTTLFLVFTLILYVVILVIFH